MVKHKSMDLKISFARPVGPYDMFWNKCTGTFCHVEMSIELEKDLFRVIVDSNIHEAYNSSILEGIMNRTKTSELKKLNACFYIMWGEEVSLRYLSDLSDDPFMSPAAKPVYETITIPLELEEMQKVVGYLLRQLGKPYDIPRALLTFSHVTLRLHGEPDKFFCSQLVMHALQYAEMYKDEIKECKNINHMQPECVYKWLVKQEPRTIKTGDGESKE